MLARRHKIDTEATSTSAQGGLAKHVATFDESRLSRLLLEVSLLGAAYSCGRQSDDGILLSTAERYRIDAERIQKSVAKEFCRQTEEEGAEDRVK